MPNAENRSSTTADAGSPDRRRGRRAAAPLAAAALAALTLAACNGEGLIAGGEYSGMPDTAITMGRGEVNAVGYMRNDGTIVLHRETGDYSPYRGPYRSR